MGRGRGRVHGVSVKASRGGFIVAFAQAIASMMVTASAAPEYLLAPALAGGSLSSVDHWARLGWSSLRGSRSLRQLLRSGDQDTSLAPPALALSGSRGAATGLVLGTARPEQRRLGCESSLPSPRVWRCIAGSYRADVPNQVSKAGPNMHGSCGALFSELSLSSGCL